MPPRGIPYIPVSQSGRTFLLARIPAGRLAAIAYVAVRGRDDEAGAVQRLLNPSRIASVKEFAAAVGVFPNSLVLNWTSTSNKIDKSDNELRFADTPRSAQLIDGQHRLEGIRAAIADDERLKRLQLPVAIYENLTTKECADIFLSINTEQKPAPRSLVFDLYGLASDTIVDPAAARAKDIATFLHDEETSPYYETIKFPGSARRKGGIALSTAVTALKPLVEENGLFDQIGIPELESQRQIILNFFVALKDAVGASWEDRSNAFLYAAGFAGAVEFLKLRLIPYCNTKKSFSVKTISQTLHLAEPILQAEIKGLGGKSAPKNIYDRLLAAFTPPAAKPAKFEI